MTDDPKISEHTKRTIRKVTRNQPLGNSDGVLCGDCNALIDLESHVKGYLIGNETGTRWKLSKVMHTDCGSRYTGERIRQSADTAALVTGTLVHDPSVSAGQPDEETVTETDTATMVSAPRGVYRLTNPEIKAVSLMSEERRKEKQQAREDAQEMIKQIQNMDEENTNNPFIDFLSGMGDSTEDDSEGA